MTQGHEKSIFCLPLSVEFCFTSFQLIKLSDFSFSLHLSFCEYFVRIKINRLFYRLKINVSTNYLNNNSRIFPRSSFLSQVSLRGNYYSRETSPEE